MPKMTLAEREEKSRRPAHGRVYLSDGTSFVRRFASEAVFEEAQESWRGTSWFDGKRVERIEAEPPPVPKVAEDGLPEMDLDLREPQ